MEVDHTKEREVVTNEILVTLTEEEVEQISETNQFAIEDPTIDFGTIVFTPRHGDIQVESGPGITATPAFGGLEVERLEDGEVLEYTSAHADADLYDEGPTITVKVE